MKQTIFIFLSCNFLFLFCSRETNEDDYLKAEVISTKDVSCPVPLLSFEDDSIKIRSITREKSIVYGVTELPASLYVENKKLYVLVQKLPAEEEFVCNTLGISYPHLKIIVAKER